MSHSLALPGRRLFLRGLGGLLAGSAFADLVRAAAPGEADEPWPPAGVPLVQGLVAINGPWSLRLPEPFARRLDGDDHVLWRPGLTILVSIAANSARRTRTERLEALVAAAPSGRDLEMRREEAAFLRWQYRLADTTDDGTTYSVNTALVADDSQLTATILFNQEHEARLAEAIAASLSWSKPG